MKKLIGLVSLVMLAFVNAFVLFCYAEPENSATLLPGQEFNQTLKRLVPSQEGASYSTNDTSINQIVQTGSIPAGVATGLISVEGTEPVTAWYESGTLYYYTEADKIYMNQNSSRMFYNMKGLVGLDLSRWDSSNVDSMSNIFYGCSSLTELDLSSWNTNNVTTMMGMFVSCTNLTSVDMSGWDFKKITSNSNNPFNNSEMKYLNLTNAKFSGNMSAFFRDMTELEEINLYGADVSNVTDMNLLFFYCEHLKTIRGLETLNTSNVTNMYGMFKYCSKLEGLNLKSFDTRKVTNMSQMFYSCNNLETIYTSTGFVTEGVTSSSSMFSNDTKLVGGNGTKYNSSKTDKEYARIDGLDGLLGYFTDVNRIQVKFMMPNGEYDVQIVPYGSKVAKPADPMEDFGGWWTKNGELYDFDTEVTGGFVLYGYKGSTLLPGKQFNVVIKNLINPGAVYGTIDTSIKQILYTGSMPEGVVRTGVVSVTGSAFPVIAGYLDGVIYLVTDADLIDLNPDSSDMFNYFQGITNIDTTKWSTSNVTDMSNMFYYCVNLTGLDVSNWNTTNVTDMESMFRDCRSMEGINLSGWDTSSVTDMSSMFRSCNKLETIYASTGFVTDKVTSSPSMFYGDTKLVGGYGTKYDSSKTDKTYAKIDDQSQTGYFTDKNQIYVRFIVGTGEYDVQSVSYGSKATRPTDPVPVGEEFVGWTTSNGEIYDFDTEVTKYTELYAVSNTATLLPGQQFNAALKTISYGYNQSYNTSNTLIKQILFTGTMPEGVVRTAVVSIITGLGTQVVAGYTGGVVYLVTHADVVYMNLDSSYMFNNLNGLENIDPKQWNTSSVTNMQYMFNNCYNLTGDLDLNGWNTSGVTNMQYMFYNCPNLRGLNLSSWNTNSVTDMQYMFYNCASLSGLNLSGWNTSSVTNMQYMFYNCYGLTGELDLSKWNTSSVTNMQYMFYNCYRLKELKLDNWDMRSVVTNIGWMFNGTSSLKTLSLKNWTIPENFTNAIGCRNSQLCTTTLDSVDVSNWNLDETTNINGLFGNLYTKEIKGLDTWDTSNVTNMGSMFQNCSNLTGLDLSSWNATNVTDMQSMFNGCTKLEKLNLDNWDISERGGSGRGGGMLAGTTSLKKISARNWKIPTTFEHVISRTWAANGSPIEEIDVSGWDLSGTTSLQGLFGDSRSLKEIKGLDTWDMSGVQNMNNMFCNCSSLTGLDLSSWDTSSVTNMGTMFYNCTGLLNLNLEGWDTSSVTEMGGMFAYCTGLTGLDVSHFDTSSVTNMNGAFDNCSSLTELNLKNWDTSSVTNMNSMFQGNSNLTTIYASNKFVTSALNGDGSSTNMFSGDINLVGGNGTVYDSSKIDKEYARIDGKNGLPGYFTYLITLSFDTDGGTLVDSQTINSGLTGTKPSDPTKTGNTFLWWHIGDDQEFDFSEPIFEPTQLYAKWQVNQYTITIDLDGESIIITGDYGSPVSKPSDPSKVGYKFIGWEPEFPTTMPAENVEIRAIWEKNGSSGGGGGGGGGSSSSQSNTGSAGSQTGSQIDTNTGSVISGTNEKELENGTGSNIQTGSQVDSQLDEKTPEQTLQNDSNAQDSQQTEQASATASEGQSYSPEFQQAYEFAHENGITTMQTIQKADMNGKLTRIAMAKMLSQYAMNVLGQKPANIGVPKFNDVTNKMDSDYSNGVTLAYQLGIMGQNMPNNQFRPNDEVTRAEFATALSRMLYNTSDGEYKSTPKYYIHHMEKLVKEGIITKDDPMMKELRGYVMIMLMRSAK